MYIYACTCHGEQGHKVADHIQIYILPFSVCETASNGFLVPVYYWKTVEKPETDPQLS